MHVIIIMSLLIQSDADNEDRSVSAIDTSVVTTSKSVSTTKVAPTTKDPLDVICGDPQGQHKILKVPSEAALNQVMQLSSLSAPASDPSKFALRLLSVFFSEEELAEGNCTYAEGRKLLDQDILNGIKCKSNKINN